ncbi:MAG: hypothetical protein JXR63_01385 [Spirochaetales bacterium]|nr:hypothetical protein [Spirochaetales bacterium]
MNKRKYLAVLFIFAFSSQIFSLKPVRYAEEFYNIYHRHLHMYNADVFESMLYLEHALAADFINPLYALAKIENESEWEQYKNLFKMHCNLEMVRMYRLMAFRHDKRKAYFYNKEFKKQNLDNLYIAKEYYKMGLYYWDQANIYAKKANETRHFFEELQNWADEKYMILTGELDFKRIIERDLRHVESVIADFEAMD